MTYTWKILKKCKWGKKNDFIEIQMSMSEYDDFKSANIDCLERYIDAVPMMTGTFGTFAAKLPSGFSDRMRQIEKNYPGAKGMLNNSKFNHTREW
jgi:hypothetical protein